MFLFHNDGKDMHIGIFFFAQVVQFHPRRQFRRILAIYNDKTIGWSMSYCLIAIIEHDLQVGRPVFEVMRIFGKSALTTNSIRDLLKPLRQEAEKTNETIVD